MATLTTIPWTCGVLCWASLRAVCIPAGSKSAVPTWGTRQRPSAARLRTTRSLMPNRGSSSSSGRSKLPVDGAGSRGFGPPAVPVHDDADVLGHLSGVQVAFHPACVQPDQQATQLVAQVHVIVSPSVRIGQTRHPAAGPRHGDPVVVAGGP